MNRILPLFLLLAGACETDPGETLDAAGDPDVDADAVQGDLYADLANVPDLNCEPPSIDNIVGLEALENPRNALSYYLSWTTPVAANSRVEVACDGSFVHTIRGRRGAVDHEVFAMGFWPGASCRLWAVAESAGCELGRDAVDIEVGGVPNSFPEIDLFASGEGVQPGWTLFNLNQPFDSIPLKVVMIDELGRYRWYHERATTITGLDTDVRTTDEGVLIGGWTPNTLPAIVNWEGEVLWEGPRDLHHHIDRLEDDTFWVMSVTTDCPGGVRTETIERIDWDSNPLWRWSICEIWRPDDYGPDWAHLNTVELVPGHDELILTSARNQHSLILVDTSAEPEDSIVWMMGQRGDFTLTRPEGAPEPAFFRQHAPEIQPNGNVLMFDNGRGEDRPFSRALEIAYDETTREVWAVWEFVPEPPIFAPIWGDADRLANGNTLAVFGLRDPAVQSHMYEVDANSNVVWAFRLPLEWGLYRAERVVDPPLGFATN